MALTPSAMVRLGTTAPSFSLPDAGNAMEPTTLDAVRGDEGTVVLFICNHCPFVKHVNPELLRLANDYIPKDIGFVAINANDAENYPEDAPERMEDVAEELGYPFPYLYDDSQDVARAYNAVCTPDFFVYDNQDKLVYRGQLDGSRPGNSVKLTGESLRVALDTLLAGKAPVNNQQPSIGCNIKWKV